MCKMLLGFTVGAKTYKRRRAITLVLVGKASKIFNDKAVLGFIEIIKGDFLRL